MARKLSNRIDCCRSWVAGDFFSTDVTIDTVLKTTASMASAATMGMQFALAGDTFVQLQLLFNTSLTTLTSVTVAGTVGFLIGIVVCGAFYDRVHRELSFALLHVVISASAVAAPFTSLDGGGGLPAFVATLLVRGFCSGFITTGTQSYIMSQWSEHRLCNPMVQAQNAIWTLGATIAPLLVEPFLVELPPSPQANANSTNSESNLTSHHWTAAAADSTTSSPPQSDEGDVFFVSYAYVTVGALILVPGVLFVIVLWRNKLAVDSGYSACRQLSPDSTPNDGDATTESGVMVEISNRADRQKTSSESYARRSRILNLMFFAMIITFYLMCYFVEIAPLSFLAVFAVNYLKFSAQTASHLMSVFSGLQLAGKLLGIPLSAVFRPKTFVMTNVILGAVSNAILFALVTTTPHVIWPASALSGLASSTLFASSLLWISETHPVTGRISALVFGGYALGGTLGQFLIGWLFESFTPLFFVYTTFAASCTSLVLFLVMNSLTNKTREWRLDLTT